MIESDKSFLLNLARQAISAKLEGEFLKVVGVPSHLKKEGCCFITLSIEGDLRGCMGHLESVESLYESVINNAVNAAFNDARFKPLSSRELQKINIEISILTPPKKLEYRGPFDLLDKISKKHGVILKKDFFQATFLPQVWNHFSSKEDFLDNLCLKAGLEVGAWRGDVDIFVYDVLSFKE